MATRKWDRSSHARSLLNKPDDLAAFGLPLIVDCNISSGLSSSHSQAIRALRNGTEKRSRVVSPDDVLYCIIADFHFLASGTEDRAFQSIGAYSRTRCGCAANCPQVCVVRARVRPH